MKLIELENISKTYRTGEVSVQALKNINLGIDKASIVSFIGPSGSGKSTLLHLLGCLLKPTDGSIKFKDQLLEKLDRKEAAVFRGENIGFIFQDFNLIPILTVYENVEYPLLMVRNMPKKERQKKIMELLDGVGMADQKDKRPNQISGGQKQRVSIARALVTRPGVILADEPTANLDHENAFKVLEIMKKLKKNYETTFIFSTHDEKIVGSAEIIFKLEDGELVK
jgi:putative ABC transport system ATP-binding protein